MIEIIGVRFNTAGKIYYFDPKGKKASLGEKVIVETARGMEMGTVALENSMMNEENVILPLKPIVRIATDADIKRAEENKKREPQSFSIALKKIEEHGLDMKLIDVEHTFDGSKILFYFTADGRVDFRDLVKSLAGIFKTRIELRQIGVRDEAKHLGGYGICGKQLCCSSFLEEFHPVSIKMAKEQGLSLNPTKISGVCGRLMCCLNYEQEGYEHMLAKMPGVGSIVDTAEGRGVVTDIFVLKGILKVKIEKKEETTIKVFNHEDVKVVKNIKKRDGETEEIKEEI